LQIAAKEQAQEKKQPRQQGSSEVPVQAQYAAKPSEREQNHVENGDNDEPDSSDEEYYMRDEFIGEAHARKRDPRQFPHAS